MNSIAQNTSNSAKSLAQQIAKQMATEPLEVLKDAREQVSGEEWTGQPDNQAARQSDDQVARQNEEQNKINDQIKNSRRMEALKREIEDIYKQNLFKDLQKRISEGEVVPLGDYPELTMDQKQVLNAQTEAVKNQMLNAKYANDKSAGVPSIHSRPTRRFGAGQKSAAQKEQTHVEKPVQNST
jgi:hypothetical protein